MNQSNKLHYERLLYGIDVYPTYGGFVRCVTERLLLSSILSPLHPLRSGCLGSKKTLRSIPSRRNRTRSSLQVTMLSGVLLVLLPVLLLEVDGNSELCVCEFGLTYATVYCYSKFLPCTHVKQHHLLATRRPKKYFLDRFMVLRARKTHKLLSINVKVHLRHLKNILKPLLNYLMALLALILMNSPELHTCIFIYQLIMIMIL